MKRTRLLKSESSREISGIGHTASTTLCDAGLSIPVGIRRIDHAIEREYAPFVRTPDAPLSESMAEEIVAASEIHAKNPGVFRDLMAVLRDHEMEAVVTEVPHAEFMELTRSSEAIVRTGECTPHANVTLKSGGAFRVPDPQPQSSPTRPAQ